MLGSGSRHAVREAVMWAVLIGVLGLGAAHFDTLTAMFGNPFGAATAPVAQTAAETSHTNEAYGSSAGFGARAVRLQASPDGHFRTTAYIEGRAIDVLVDTGASGVALTYEDARRLGLAPSQSDYTHEAHTANGVARIAPVTLGRVRIGDVSITDVPGFVGEPGAISETLLGMSFLRRLGRFEMQGRDLVLEE